MRELHGTHESVYEYDGASRRWRITEKESGTQTKQETFVWCGSKICQKRNGSTVTRSYFGNGFQESGSTNYFYTRDHLGSVREVVGNDGTTVASRLSYDPWGKATESGSGALSDFTYTGHYYDRATGLNLAQYRAYDAGLGRWISRDPAGLRGGLNLYGYTENNPVNYIDPDGRWVVPVVVAIGVATVFVLSMGSAAPSDTAQAPADILAMSAAVAGLKGLPSGMCGASAVEGLPGSVGAAAAPTDEVIAAHAAKHWPKLTRQQLVTKIEQVREAGTTIVAPNGNKLTYLKDGTILIEDATSFEGGTIFRRQGNLGDYINGFLEQNQ